MRIGQACLVLALGGLAATDSCAGGSPAAVLGGAGRSALPALPAPALLEGRGSSWAGGYIPPAQYEAQGLPHNRVHDSFSTDAIEFSAFANEPAALNDSGYCIYRTEASGDALGVSFEWETPPPPGTFYFGLGNHAANRWEWRALADPQVPTVVSPAAAYIDGEGFALLALVQTGTPDGALTTSTLNAIRVDSNPPAGGWHFVRIAQAQTATPETYYPCRLLEHGGKPLVTAFLPAAPGDHKLQCLFSSSAAGLAEADWSSVELLPEAGPYPYGLASIGGALQLAALTASDGLLHSRHAANPAGSWTESTADASGFQTFPNQVRLGVLDGGPVLAFHVGPDMGGSGNDYVGYGYPDGEGQWQLSLAKDLGYFGNIIHFTQPFEVGGLPLILCEQYENGPGSGLYYMQASTNAPTGEADWTSTRIADAVFDDFRLGLAADLLDGRPYAIVTHTQFNPTPEIKLFYLPGADPAPSNWLQHTAAYLDFSLAQSHAFAVIGSRPALLNAGINFSGDTDPVELDLLTGVADMPAGASDWASRSPSLDAGAEGFALAEVGGQPAIAMVQEIKGAGDEVLLKVIYGVYVP